MAASAEQRQVVYRWLFKNHKKIAQQRRIMTLLEEEAFKEIHTRLEARRLSIRGINAFLCDIHRRIRR